MDRRFASLARVAVSSLVLALPPLGAEAAPTRIVIGAPAEVTAPTPTRPMDERRFDFEEPVRGLVELSWEPCPGAGLYQVQISTSEDFSSPANHAHELVAGEPATRVEVQGLPPGGYYWRVAAVDLEGRRGAWSKLRRFSVNEGPPPAAGEGPGLEITSSTPVGAKIIIRGVMKGDGRLEASVNGVPAGDVPVGDNGEFSVMLDANTLGRNVVLLLAVDKRGRTTTQETSFHYAGN